MTFVNETEALVSHYEDDSDSDTPRQTSDSGPAESPYSTVTQAPQTSSPKSPMRRESSWTLDQSPRPTSAPSFELSKSPIVRSVQRPNSASKLPPLHELIQLPSPTSSVATGSHFSSERLVNYPALPNILDATVSTSIYLDKPVWPLRDPAEALLLRHYVQNLAIWVSKGKQKCHNCENC